MIDGYQLPLTCFAAATALERNREVAAWLTEAGHEPCSHGWRWEEVWTLSRTYWEEGAERPRMMSIGLHPRLIGQAARIAGLKDFLDYALDKGDVWFAKRIDIAHWRLEHHEEFTR